MPACEAIADTAFVLFILPATLQHLSLLLLHCNVTSTKQASVSPTGIPVPAPPPPRCHRPGRSRRRSLPRGAPGPAAPRSTVTAGPPLLPPAPRQGPANPAVKGLAESGQAARGGSGRGVAGRAGDGVTSGGGRGEGPSRAEPGRLGSHSPTSWSKGLVAKSGIAGARRGQPSRQRGGGARSRRRQRRLLLPPRVPPPPPPPPRPGEPAPCAQHAGKPRLSPPPHGSGSASRPRCRPRCQPAAQPAAPGELEGPPGPFRRHPRPEPCLALGRWVSGGCPAWPGFA